MEWDQDKFSTIWLDDFWISVGTKLHILYVKDRAKYINSLIFCDCALVQVLVKVNITFKDLLPFCSQINVLHLHPQEK
jgi:hypothetical protein